MRHLRWSSGLVLLAFLVTAPTAPAQIADNLAGFTDENTKGYLEPLRDVFGSGLSDGIYSSADLNSLKPYVRLDLRVMVVRFSDSDRTYMANPESYFPGTGTYEVPTVIGDETGQTVTSGPAQFTFPGGLDVSGLPIAAPQLVVGGVMGSEGILRYFNASYGDNELGEFSLFGIGARHSISQYLPA